MSETKPKLYQAHARLFPEDVKHLKKVARERGSSWHIELRMLVRRAIRGEQREVIVIDKEKGS